MREMVLMRLLKCSFSHMMLFRLLKQALCLFRVILSLLDLHDFLALLKCDAGGNLESTRFWNLLRLISNGMKVPFFLSILVCGWLKVVTSLEWFPREEMKDGALAYKKSKVLFLPSST